MRRHHLHTIAVLALVALLAACTQKNTADIQDQTGAAAADVALGVNRFLLFPNPIGTDPFAQDGGTFETNTQAYAQAYYDAIDRAGLKTTLDDWKTANGFTGVESAVEHLAVFRDVKDLGYGRRMTGRFNGSNGVAFFVENYNVTPNGSAGYSSELNADAAIRRDTQWHVGTNAIEWSTTPCIAGYDPPDCNGTVKFAKYYNFSSRDGTRQLAVDLDGHGLKAMPGPCITCHGGRGDPLTDTGSTPRFPLVENSLSRKRGDVQARLHGMNVDSFSYSTTQPGFAKSDLQSKLLDFNQWIMCTYPWDPTGTTSQTINGQNGWGSCTRTVAGPNEWQGIAAEMIQSWYGGPAMNATFSDAYVPPTWNSTTTITGTNFAPIDLYSNVVAPYCRTCHVLRGTKNQNDIDFMTYGVPAAGVTPATGFLSFADRIKVMVFDRGNMPLAQIPHQDFWNSSAPQTLASFVDAMTAPGTATSNGAPLMPGRPIADPGPDRMVRTGANAVLTGENSLFASTFSWTNVSGPSNPLITNATQMVAIFNANVAGTYVVRLTVNGGAASKDVTITVDDSFPDLFNIRFAHVKNVLQSIPHAGSKTCMGCHTVTSTPMPANTPPIWYNNFDRDGSGGAVNGIDDTWFIKALAGRVNLTEIEASPLLRKPTGNHHNGGKLLDVATSAGLRNYSILYNWILAGMPSGGAAANAGADTSNTVTFSGSPLAASVPLDGDLSIGATSFFWSVVSGPNGPTGAVPTISNPTSSSIATSPLAPPALNVPNIGTYVVQLQVSDGALTDTDQRTIIVGENSIGADFSPADSASAPITSLPTNIALTNTSSGNPTNCLWQVVSGPPATLTSTTSCTATNLHVAGLGTYGVKLTVSNIASSSTIHTFAVTSGTPVGANIVVNNGTTPISRGFNTGANPAALIPGTASVPLSSSGSTGVLPLSFSWSITAQPDSTNGAATLSSTTAAAPTLTVRATGFYTVRLDVTDAANSTTFTTNTFRVVPTNGTTFSTMTGLFGSIGCTGCHSYVNGATNPDPANNSGLRPSWALENDSNNKTLWQRVFQRILIGNPTGSLLYENPNNSDPAGHGGLCQPGFPCAGSTVNSAQFSSWITDGGPPGD